MNCSKQGTVKLRAENERIHNCVITFICAKVTDQLTKTRSFTKGETKYERQLNTSRTKFVKKKTTEHNKTQYKLKLLQALQSESDFATTRHPQNLHHVQVQLLHVSTVQKNVFCGPNIPSGLLLSILNTAQEVCKIVLFLASGSGSHCCQARRGT